MKCIPLLLVREYGIELYAQFSLWNLPANIKGIFLHARMQENRNNIYFNIIQSKEGESPRNSKGGNFLSKMSYV